MHATHPVFEAAPAGTKAIYVWDDDYLRGTGYSLKRLVFIYETVCELPIEILHGPLHGMMQDLAPSRLCIPATSNPSIAAIVCELVSTMPVQMVEDEVFAAVDQARDDQRFFGYWKKAEKSAFRKNGGEDQP